LAVVISTKFSQPIIQPPSCLAFAVGFVVRPFGALFFGRLGDLIGKYTFMVTLLMGGATFLIGCVLVMKQLDSWRQF
jgi:MFS family permease